MKIDGTQVSPYTINCNDTAAIYYNEFILGSLFPCRTCPPEAVPGPLGCASRLTSSGVT